MCKHSLLYNSSDASSELNKFVIRRTKTPMKLGLAAIQPLETRRKILTWTPDISKGSYLADAASVGMRRRATRMDGFPIYTRERDERYPFIFSVYMKSIHSFHSFCLSLSLSSLSLSLSSLSLSLSLSRGIERARKGEREKAVASKGSSSAPFESGAKSHRRAKVSAIIENGVSGFLPSLPGLLDIL